MMKRTPRRSPMALPLQQNWRNDDARTLPVQRATATATSGATRQRKHPRSR